MYLLEEGVIVVAVRNLVVERVSIRARYYNYNYNKSRFNRTDV
jgi:hypothetical protein